MKKLLYISLPLLLAITLLNCSKQEDITPVQYSQTIDKTAFDTLTVMHSMKGWELYSWPSSNNWYFSFLPGTNRVKTFEEVTNSPFIIYGKDSLKLMLNKFPKNESIAWNGEEWLERCWNKYYGNISLPDVLTQADIKAYCIQKELILNINE